jgi:hypothetical protein
MKKRRDISDWIISVEDGECMVEEKAQELANTDI